jgi:hypothetical protein
MRAAAQEECDEYDDEDEEADCLESFCTADDEAYDMQDAYLLCARRNCRGNF